MEHMKPQGGLSVLNPSPIEVDGASFLHDLVQRSNDPAINYVANDKEKIILSYDELQTATDILAREIIIAVGSSQIKQDEEQAQFVVPLLIPQSPELYIAQLAILKAGGAFCPLNLDAPTERIKFILQDVSARVVLCTAALADRLPVDEYPCRIIETDSILRNHLDKSVNAEISEHGMSRRTPDSLAYVMYTSGSTGVPKGVGISHKAATQALLAHDRHIPPFKRFLQFAAPTFDVSVFEIFFPLMRGSTLVCCDRTEMLSDLPGTLSKYSIDACELTPSVAGSLLKTRERAPGLKLLLTIGEMLTAPVVQEFGGKTGDDSILWAMYGPTEATIHCTLQPAFLQTNRRQSIGFPLDNVSVFIIDAHPSKPFEPLPLGEAGELVVGGTQLAVGYINRVEQTAAAFIDSPYGRVYRTGDKAVMKEDGTIECLGRINDTQVKLNGQRMELGEVEQVMLGTSGCHSAVAAVVDKTLVAFAAVEDVEGAETKIVDRCKSWLPSFMVPSDIQIMLEFPRLPSGKVDRKQLVADYKARELTRQTTTEEYLDDEEREMCVLASRLLDRHIQPVDNLAALGVDSLVAIELASEFRQKNVQLTPLEILEHPTIRELRSLMQRKTRPSPQPVAQPRVGAVDLYFEHLTFIEPSILDHAEHVDRCTSLQKAMISETLRDSRLYINEINLSIPSAVDAATVRQWFKVICSENEILRSGFIQTEDELYHITWKELQENQIKIVESFNEIGRDDTERFLQHPLNVQIKRHESQNGDDTTVKITIHHAIYDGWTTDLIVRHLNQLHRGKESPPKAQFRDTIRATERFKSERMLEAREFWAEELRGSAAATIPNFRTRPVPSPQICSTHHMILISKQQTTDFCQKLGVSNQVIFQAAIAWLWSAVVGVDDITIGSVFSGRTVPVNGIENAMGPFMSTLPLRVQFSHFQTLQEFLQVVHASNRRSIRHVDLSLPEIKTAAGIPTHSRIFDIVFAYQESLLSRKAKDYGVRELSHKDALEAALLVEIQPLQDGYSCQITWHSDVFPEAMMQKLAGQLENLVLRLVQNDTIPVTSLRSCFQPDQLSKFNEQPKSLEILPSLARLIEKTAEKFPNNQALLFAKFIEGNSMESQSLTYIELNQQANQISRHIESQGVQPGDVVAIVMEKSPVLYASILGILKTGGAYLPILPSTPATRKHRIFEQAGPRICLTTADLHQQLSKEINNSLVIIDEDAISRYNQSNVEIETDVNSHAYVIYTSGTTGVPKGVAVTNKNMLSNIEAVSALYPHNPSSRMLQACSQAFDVSVFEIFFAWANGMCLCAATHDVLFGDLSHTINMLQVTHLSMTVTVASLLSPEQVPSVEFLVTSGEAMTDEVLAKWHKQLWQGYGPSETTNICTVRKVAERDSSQFLGWAFENTSTFVCYQDSNNLVPVGCVGEFCFGGDQVAAGYLKMPELTADKFFDHPDYGRLYRSGDQGRMLPDGSLIILGRIDTQIKLRGLRIELKEIEKTVLQTGLSRACEVIVSKQQDSKTEQLALFYVPTAATTAGFEILPTTESLEKATFTIQQDLQAALPDYMVPSFFIPISTLPLTSSGKVDRTSLRTQVEALSKGGLETYSAVSGLQESSTEWTATEKLVAETAANLTKTDIKTIKQWSSFATLGIDSILAMSFARKLQKVFDRRVTFSTVMKSSSIGRLAAALEEESQIDFVPLATRTLLPTGLVLALRDKMGGQWGEIESILPCTPLQESMLFAGVRSTSSDLYCNQMFFKLHSPIEDILSYWRQMFNRHEILRTLFASTDEVLYPVVQVVMKSCQPDIEVLELASVSQRSWQIEQAQHKLPAAIDSGKTPVALTIFRVFGEDDYLSFVCHHALYDGISTRNLLSEIETLASGGLLPQPVAFEPFLTEALREVPESDDFWRHHFKDFAPTFFQPNVSEFSTEDISIYHDFTAQNLSSVEARLKECGVSLLSLCQASWATTLSMLQGSSDVCFGNVVSGRSVLVESIDRLVAPCFNTIPSRINLSNFKLRVELAKKMQSLNSDLLPYHFTPLRRIQALTASAKLFDTLLILQPEPTELDGRVWELVQEGGDMGVPIVCEITPDRKCDVLRFGLHRQHSEISKSLLSLAHDIFQIIMAQCLEHPSSRLVSRSDLPEELRNKLLNIRSISSSPKKELGSSTEVEDGKWSPTEKLVRAAISKLTTVSEDKINRGQPLFRYGIDSIGIVQLVGLLEKESIRVSVADAMENPTCANIARKARISDNNVNDDKAPPGFDFEQFQQEVAKDVKKVLGVEVELEDILPCTSVQQGMISQSIVAEGQLYFNSVSWELDPTVEPQRLTNAWEHVRNAHQILRTGFVPVSHSTGSYAMVVYKSESQHAMKTPQIDLRREVNLANWRLGAAKDVFNDLSLPPWRLLIAEENDRKLTMYLAIHHGLYDAHSLQIILGDLRDYLLYQRDIPMRKTRPSLEKLLLYLENNSEFWKDKASEMVVNKFPTMTPLVEPRGVAKTSRNSGMSLSEIKATAAEANVSVQAALQVAWTRLLAAYLGEDSVTFGVVFAGRSSAGDLEASIPMVVTMPVVAHSTGTVAEQLRRMMQYNAGLHRHYRTSPSSIQSWLGRPNEPLFDTILVYQVASCEETKQQWKIIDEYASVEYAVSLEIEETSKGLHFNIVCDTSILPQQQAEILLQQFEGILMDILEATARTVDSGQSLGISAALPQSILSILPAPQPVMPCQVELLHQMVEASVQSCPNSTALEFVDDLDDPTSHRRWTYTELNEMGNKVANFLLTKNICEGSIVAVCFNKVPEAYFSIYGILKAGCCFLALDPSAPPSRQEFILGDSHAACLLVEDRLDSQLGFKSPVPVYTVSSGSLGALAGHSPSLSRSISPSSPCYCLYTSGTTGTPKGCLISHENTVQAMLAFEYLFKGHWTETSRWLQFASFHFDVSVLEQYWSWYVGITVVSVPRDVILSNLIETISGLKITHIDLTPSLARLVTPDDVPTLCEGVFITGGEQLRQDVLEAWGPEQVIYNAYGPTEATIGVTMFQRVPKNGRPVNIGRQFPNVGAYVLEPGTEIPVLRGGIGELCVSGKLVGIGYLNRPELNEQRFAFLNSFSERVYRTGDLVRVLHDGTFDFLGRADDQIKLRGQRLEIGEINHAIKSGLPYQADVATLVTKHHAQSDRDVLVSFITAPVERNPKNTLQAHTDAVAYEMSLIAQNACKAHLPGYMVPTYTLCVPWIPLSANNKADLKVLKELFQSMTLEELRKIAAGTKSAQRGLNELEMKIAKIVSEITNVDVAEAQHSSTILELGVDSISVTRLARSLQAAGFAQATPSALLKNGQIDRIAKLISKSKSKQTEHDDAKFQVQQALQACYRQNIGRASATLGVREEDIEYIAPCTPLQEGMIARNRTSTDGSPYFNQFELKLKPGISSAKLATCWQQLQNSSSILRTAFLQTSEGFIQIALKKSNLKWTEVRTEAAALTELLARKHAEWVQSNQEVLGSPFEIDHVTCDSQELLVIRIFHALYDAHSLNLMLEDVAHAYEGETMALGAKFLEALQAGPLLAHQSSRVFWTDLFQSWQPKALSHSAAENDQTSETTTMSRTISIDGFEATRKANNVTHQTLVQAAWFVTLQNYLSSQPCFGVVYSGRSLDLDGADNVIGPLFNTLPFTTKLDGTTTWKQLTKQIQDFNTSVLDVVHTPLRSIQKWCTNGRPLFDSLFTFDREDVVETGSKLWDIGGGSAAADYTLALEVVLMRDGVFNLTVVAQQSAVQERMLHTLLDDLEDNLSTMANCIESTAIITTGTLLKGPNMEDDALGSGTSAGPSTRSVSPSLSSTSSWSDQNLTLRHEIAILAGVNDEEVLPSMTIFDLGLDSIDAIRLASKATSHGYRIAPGALLRGMTVGSIFLNTEAQSKTPAEDGNIAALEALTPLLKESLIKMKVDMDIVEDVLPTTPLQDAMLAEMMNSNYQRYYNHEVFELSPEIDLERLKEAWQQVYTRSPILRTAFAVVDINDLTSAHCQMVLKSQLEFGDIKLANTERLAAFIQTITKDASHRESRLFRLTICRIGGKNHLLVTMAHALYDGKSLDMLYGDVQDAYHGITRERPDYKPYLAHMLSKNDAATGFWTSFMRDVRPTLLQPFIASHNVEGQGVYRAEMVPTTTIEAIKNTCRTLGVTAQVLAQAIWSVVLSTLSQDLESTFGLVLSGRDTDAAQEIMFPTMNTVVMRSIMHGTVKDFLRHLQTTMSHLMEFQHTALRDIQYHAGQFGKPLFNTLFVFQAGAASSGQGAPIVRSIESGVAAVEYPICIEFELSRANGTWRIACDSNYGTSDTAQGILANLDKVMQYFCNGYDDTIIQPIIGSDEVSLCGLPSFRPKSREEITAIDVKKRKLQSDEKMSVAEVNSDLYDVLYGLTDQELDIMPEDHISHYLDSISAIKASSLLRKRGIALSVREILDSTVAQGSRLADKARRAQLQSERGDVAEQVDFKSLLDELNVERLVSRSSFRPDDIEEILPATPMQVHMISAWQNTNGDLFWPTFRYKLTGDVNTSRAIWAWEQVIAETPLLRTAFICTGSDRSPLLQVVVKSNNFRLTQKNKPHGGMLWIGSSSPFVYAQVQELNSYGKIEICLQIHHALYDAFSLPLIMSRFADIYQSNGLPSQQHVWKKMINDSLSDTACHRREAFWSSYLADVKFSPRMHAALGSNDHTTGDPPSTAASEFRASAMLVTPSMATHLSANRISMQHYFFAATAQVLSRLAAIPADSDVVIGIYLSNRSNLASLDQVAAPTLALLPVRVRAPLSRPLVDIAGEIRGDLENISSVHNISAGLWEIKKWTEVTVDVFVNFLPVIAESNDSEQDWERRVKIEHVAADQTGSGDEHIEITKTGDYRPAAPDMPQLAGNHVRESYPDALDIEAAVRNGGLDIGVFSRPGKMSPDQAKGLIDEVVRVMKGVQGDI